MNGLFSKSDIQAILLKTNIMKSYGYNYRINVIFFFMEYIHNSSQDELFESPQWTHGGPTGPTASSCPPK